MLPHYDKIIIKYLYSDLFNSENIPKSPNRFYSKLSYDINLLVEAKTLLKSTMYDDLEIIVNELINPDILQILGAKFNAGEKLSKLERIIADVAILSGSINNDQMYGKVNSESHFSENSFEKAKENQESLSFIQKFKHYIKRSIAVIVRGFSMSGVFEDGDVVGAKKVTRFSRYKTGDIIVFTNKDGERVIHMIVGTTRKNGKMEYITWGVNNQKLDEDPVARKYIIGKVVLSMKEQYKILAEARQGKVLIIDANGMVRQLDNDNWNPTYDFIIELLKENFGNIEFQYESGLLSMIDKLKYGIPFHDLLTIHEKAAIILDDIISYHIFEDANKRFASLLLSTFLNRNGLELTASESDIIKITEEIAMDLISYNEIVEWIIDNTKPK